MGVCHRCKGEIVHTKQGREAHTRPLAAGFYEIRANIRGEEKEEGWVRVLP